MQTAQNPKYPPPPFPRVPNVVADPLTIKLSQTGVTVLREGSYKKRLTGGECHLDINGRLHYSRKEFKNFIEVENHAREKYNLSMTGKPAKRNPPKTAQSKQGVSSNLKPGMQDNKNYTVNKKEVTARILSMTGAMFSAVRSNAFLGMLTVSFPPAVTQAAGMQALNTWLTSVRGTGYARIKNYLWVSEFQKNGTIHYHLLVLNRVNAQSLNRQMKITLCNMVRAGVIKYPLAAMKRYNGVDLAKDRKTRQVTNFCDPSKRKTLTFYITKYVTKNNAVFERAAWGCSRAFSVIFTGLTCTFPEFMRLKWGICDETPVISNEWFEFFPWANGPPAEYTGYMARVNRHILEYKGFLN